jgi:hypothetical protein
MVGPICPVSWYKGYTYPNDLTGLMLMLRLSLACGDYDRTRPLIDGTVRPLGIDLTCLPMTI